MRATCFAYLLRSLAVGSLILCTLLPFVGPVVFMAMVWEYADRGFAGGFINSGRELSGFLLSQVLLEIREQCKIFRRLVTIRLK